MSTMSKVCKLRCVHTFIIFVTPQMILCLDSSVMEITNLLNSEKFRHAHRECHADTSTVLTAQQAQELLERPEVNTDKLVPEGIWIVETWEPFGCFTSNYKKMINNEVVITREHNDQHVVAISFFDYYRVQPWDLCSMHISTARCEVWRVCHWSRLTS